MKPINLSDKLDSKMFFKVKDKTYFELYSEPCSILRFKIESKIMFHINEKILNNLYNKTKYSLLQDLNEKAN